MVKVLIKKNIKPKTTKQKQKQTQKTNVTVNISSDIIKKKRGRPVKRSKMEKQTTKPASQQPITQSYNQPIFKQSTPQQPSSLSSAILASQNIPTVIKEEVKEESALKKALIDQNLSTEEPETKTNDLERVRKERLKKFETPKIEIKKEEPIRSALLGQLLSEQGDDTEEIQNLFNPVELKEIFTTEQTTPLSNRSYNPSNASSLTVSGTSTPNPLSTPVNPQTLYDKLSDIQDEEPEPDQEIEGTTEISPSITEANEAIRLVQDALNPSEGTSFETPSKEKTILEPSEATATILEPSKKEQPLISNQAEEPRTEIKSVDGPTPDFNATPPRYTKAQINKLRVIPMGEVITAEKIKDTEGRNLIFNGQRVFREGKKGTQINAPELRSILLSHYGIED